MKIVHVNGKLGKKGNIQLKKFGRTYFSIEAHFDSGAKLIEHFVSKPTRKQVRSFKKLAYMRKSDRSLFNKTLEGIRQNAIT